MPSDAAQSRGSQLAAECRAALHVDHIDVSKLGAKTVRRSGASNKCFSHFGEDAEGDHCKVRNLLQHLARCDATACSSIVTDADLDARPSLWRDPEVAMMLLRDTLHALAVAAATEVTDSFRAYLVGGALWSSKVMHTMLIVSTNNLAEGMFSIVKFEERFATMSTRRCSQLPSW